MLVSKLGADAKSKEFYNRTRGKIEARVVTLCFDRVGIVRPALLKRVRAGLHIGDRLAPAASRIIVPVLPARLRPVHSGSVARAMIAAAKN